MAINTVYINLQLKNLHLFKMLLLYISQLNIKKFKIALYQYYCMKKNNGSGNGMQLLTKKDISLTKKATKRIQELKEENNSVFIRIMIANGGCAGKQYCILMDDYIGETDFCLRKRFKNKLSVYVVIDENSLKYVKGSKMDFADGLEFSGFTLKNPNVKAMCNCGNSFSCNECELS